jgi:diphthamide biosynthesis protein 2
MGEPRLAPLEAGEQPLWLFLILALLNIVDSFNLNVVWPMLPFMVESFGVVKDEADLGAWVGVAGAAVSIGQLISAYAWGALSDVVGRRPVMLVGMFTSTFTAIIFGTSTTYAQCVASRFLTGLLNGNAGVVKTYVGEVTSKSQQAKAFSLFALCFGLASCVAPAIGGFLQRPAERWPGTFAGTLFETYPYLLPMLCASCLTTLGGIAGYLFVPETASQWRRMRRRRFMSPMQRADSSSAVGYEMVGTTKKSRAYGDGDEEELLPGDETELTAVTVKTVDDRSKVDDRPKASPKMDVDGEEDGDDDDAELGLLSPAAASSSTNTARREPDLPESISPPRVSRGRAGVGEDGWNRHTVTATVAYAFLAAIAIGYDEIFPVFAKTSRSLGGLGMSAENIGAVLVFGGFTLVSFQLLVFPALLRLFGVTSGLRKGAIAFAAACLIAPCASLIDDAAARWAVLLVSQGLKITTLALLFSCVIIAVNNSCENRAKARVNGVGSSLAALGRVVSPVVHGLVFSWSLRLEGWREKQFVVFIFVSACSLGFYALVSLLPKELDTPPREVDDEGAVTGEETT